MAGGYIHVETLIAQASKHADRVCGDVAEVIRTPVATTVIVSDGIGSGIKANLAATMCVARLRRLIEEGQSLREAMAAVVATMEKAKGTAEPYAVFALARILSDGDTTVLTYEMPGPILLGPRHAEVIPPRPLPIGDAIGHEYGCHLTPGEGLVLVSDGITQAGLGRGLRTGWELDGAARHASHLLGGTIGFKELPRALINRAHELCQNGPGDDCTVVLAACQYGRTLNILTGPPAIRDQDRAVVTAFLARDGWKAVCGGTTAGIVGRIMGRRLEALPDEQSMVAPPRFRLDGIDLVSEGAITLNQVYNVLDADPSAFDEDSAVTQLHGYLMAADRVNFIVGGSGNPANGHISFRQRGIIDRRHIVPLLADQLRAAGKLVVVENA